MLAHDKRVLWDLIKYKIRQVTAPPSQDNIAELERTKQVYESPYYYIIQGRIIRSKATWYKKGEKNCKFFLNLESNRSGKTYVPRLYNSDGQLIISSQLILGELKRFYQNLYSNQDSQNSVDINAEFLDNVNLPKMAEGTKLLCEGELSIQECYNALLKFPNGKSPGNDGLTAEFYKAFWNLLGQQLTDSLTFSYQHGELSNTQKQAIIKLIEKKDKGRRYIKNWRPISLLNVDVKIASKALALRLEKALPDIIGCDQYAYVKGSTIFDAIRSIDDIMEFTKLTD